MLVGGPSQIDTWDPKPEAPSNVRSPFRPIRTNVAGIEISEIFPRMARQADKYALIRSCYHTGEPLHEIGQQLVQTGRVSDEGHSAFAGNLLLPGPIGNTGCDLPHGQEGCRVVAPSPHFNPKYGNSRFGQNVAHARELIESGAARFVTVNMFDTVFHQPTWDVHGSAPFSPLSCYRDHVGPMFDQAYSALLEDLSRSGRLADTLVVATGEFGRTPRVNPAGGRDHWPECWTVLMAGGGVRGGQVIGSSDAHGAAPKDRPVHASEIAATIHYAMGIKPVDAQPVTELFA